jgi:glycosyltransferase involved in cell wall biosynthesis
MSSSCYVRTRHESGGGSIYELKVSTLHIDGINLIEWPASLLKLTFLKYNKLQYLLQTLNEHPKKGDILITSDLYHYGIQLKKFTKTVLIIHHIDQSQTKRRFLNVLLENKMLRELYKFDKIVTVSEFWRNELKKYVDERKIDVIYNSFDVPAIVDICNENDIIEFKKSFNIPLDKIIVYAGNSTTAKGTDRIVELIGNNPFYHLITSGKKEKDFGTQHLNLSYHDYIRLLNSSDITVILSRLKEGWNRIAHESLLCKTPVIGLDIAGLGELLNKSKQIIFRPGEDINMLIDKALTNKTYAENGFSFAYKFDFEYFRQSWQSLLYSL